MSWRQRTPFPIANAIWRILTYIVNFGNFLVIRNHYVMLSRFEHNKLTLGYLQKNVLRRVTQVVGATYTLKMSSDNSFLGLP